MTKTSIMAWVDLLEYLDWKYMKNRFNFNTVGLFTTDNKATVDFYTETFGRTTEWDGVQPKIEIHLELCL